MVSNMSKKGLLVSYNWCTGCHSCEIACQMENGLPVDQFGIKVSQIGPWQYGEDKWQYAYIPTITDQCTLCGKRVEKGKQPSCVQHCQAKCLKIVSEEEAAAAIAENGKQLFMTL